MNEHSLTSEQWGVVNAPPGAWLVTAPPGCGKTEVLTRRIERLLTQSGRRRSRVLVLTFTRRAAQGVVERVRQALPAHTDRVVAQTFHQFALELLRQQAPSTMKTLHAGRAERLLALRSALDGMPVPAWQSHLDQVLNEIELAKKNRSFEDPTGMSPDLRAAFDAYVSYQQREGICDFDDLILDATELLRSLPSVSAVYRQLFTSVLVDEGQDLNRSQYEFLRALLGDSPNDVMILADDRQSIFAFNGADVRLLDAFVAQYSAKRFALTMSFRCGRQIVSAANIIASRLGKVTPDLLRDDPVLASGSVEILRFTHEREEALAVVDRIAGLLAHGLPQHACHQGERLALLPEEIVVLGRSRYALAEVERCLRERTGGRIFVSYDREDTLTSSAAQSVVWLMRVLSRPSDRISMVRLAENVSMASWVGTGLSSLLANANGPFEEFHDHLRRWKEGHAGGEVSAVLTALDSAQPLTGEDAAALASDREYLGRIRAALRRKFSRDPTPAEFVQELAVSSTPDSQAPGVRVMTVHAAKGLEFRVVFVVGLAAGVFPSYRAKTDKEQEEERRLAYVAFTRASRLLVLTYPSVRRAGSGSPMGVEPSPFISELRASMPGTA